MGDGGNIQEAVEECWRDIGFFGLRALLVASRSARAAGVSEAFLSNVLDDFGAFFAILSDFGLPEIFFL